ncbi:MAG: formate dehydrogenase accessory protein FdhE [Planctomycetaceae bacterium]|nr:formate dehydrogenase accessory protein FdhE [Planctomycetaceae bacterium]
MPIQLKCPNGHHLTAKESNAGKTGKCPVCKAVVKIPVLHQKVISDSAVVSILGDPSNVKKDNVKTIVTPVKKKNTRSSTSSTSSISPHVRICPNCEQEIDMGYHICPHCHTYITGLNDF